MMLSAESADEGHKGAAEDGSRGIKYSESKTVSEIKGLSGFYSFRWNSSNFMYR